ncbi:MAG: hypothetical protein ACK4SP_11940 [Sphingomonas parapaucimobilis]
MSDPAIAQNAFLQPPPRQLHGLSSTEADLLIEKLKDAQIDLKSGKFEYFELLAGSIASYEKVNVSPRDAFLSTPFDKAWDIERIHSDNTLRNPYRLSYAPDGLGKPYWKIDVILGISGDIQRVEMLYTAPAPF